VNVSPTTVSANKVSKSFITNSGRKIVNYFFCFRITNCRSRRNWNYTIFTIGTVSIPTLSITSVASLKTMFMTQFCQRSKISFNSKNNIATFTPIATIWPTMRNIFFTAKSNTTISTISRTNFNQSFISKTYHFFYLIKKKARL